MNDELDNETLDKFRRQLLMLLNTIEEEMVRRGNLCITTKELRERYRQLT